MKCLLFAPLDAHATIGRIAALCGTALEVHLADTSDRPVRFDVNRYPFNRLASIRQMSLARRPPNRNEMTAKMSEIVDAYLGPEGASLDAVRDLLLEVKPSVVVTFYGPQAIRAAELVKVVAPELPVIDILNLIPSALERQTRISRAIQPWINDEMVRYRRQASRIDHFVCCSPLMQQHICDRYSVPPARTTILPDYLSRCMYVAQPRARRQNGPPRAIYLGAPERWGNSIDSVDDELLELVRAGVEVAAARLSPELVATGMALEYERLTDEQVFAGALAEYAHDFDVAIVTYAVDSRHERFRTTLPTRFFSAIAAAVPIAVRRGVFDAVEAYIEEHGIGLSYSDGASLSAALSDRPRLQLLRERAIAHAAVHCAEAQSDDLRNLIRGLV
jgi:hypothetical protein